MLIAAKKKKYLNVSLMFQLRSRTDDITVARLEIFLRKEFLRLSA